MGWHGLARNGPCLARRRLLLCPAPRRPRCPPLLSLPLPSQRPRPRPHPPPRRPLRLLPPPLLSFRDLRSATASFDPSRSLGRGASAVVFHGVLPDGKSVAVKRLDHPSSSSPSSSPPQTFSNHEFHNELHILAALPPSPFVVSLLGYCLDSPHRRLLVYEYMPNGSLQDALFSSSNHHLVLSWDSRFGIVLDVAQALAFLSWDRRLGSGLGARLARQAT